MAESLAAGFFLAQSLNSGSAQIPPLPHAKPNHTSPQQDLQANLSSLPRPKSPVIYAVLTELAQFGHPDRDKVVDVGAGPLFFPAAVPLLLKEISLEVQCHISTAFVSVVGTWVLNCVKSGKQCDCLMVIPMQHQGTVAAVDIQLGEDRVYTTLVIPKDDAAGYAAKGSNSGKPDDLETYNPEIFRLTIPQVDSGTKLCLKITWFESMVFVDGRYSITVPFALDDYASLYGTPEASISCTINTGTSKAVESGGFNHPMKETFREAGRASFAMSDEEGDGPKKWVSKDFTASYSVWSEGIFPNLIVQDPTPGIDIDPRGTFCLSIAPPDPSHVQAFQRGVIFLLDRSGSMTGRPIADARRALLFGMSKLQSADSFSIIAFDHESIFFSPILVNATEEAVVRANKWVEAECKARGGTDIFTPLCQAMKMLENLQGAVPYIFLITDGAVSDEAHICREVQTRITNAGPAAPRVSTFGIGTYCNYYFLKMLAMIGRGLSDVAFKADSIQEQMERMLLAASTPLLTNISLAIADLPQGCEVYPFPIPDLFCGNPLIVSGRFHGTFPSSINIVGLLPGGTVWQLAVPSRMVSHIPLSRVFAKQQLDVLTARAWLNDDKRLQQEAVNLSMVIGIPCEYTRMIGFETTKDNFSKLQEDKKKGQKLDIHQYTSGTKKVAAIAVLGGLVLGFGSIAATAGNLPVGGALIEGAIEGVFECCDCCGLGDCVGDCIGDFIGSLCENLAGDCCCEIDFVGCCLEGTVSLLCSVCQ